MAAVSLTALVNVLREQQFLRPDHLHELPTLLTTCADPASLAWNLVQRGWLTDYQARHLLRDEADKLILGPYRLLDPLGEGGMGKVFKARHTHLDRVVALKFIQAEQLAGPNAVERFAREVRAAAQLTHPNIVVAHDAGRVGGTPYLAMELVEGIDLARLVQQSGPLPVAQACDYARQAALGLQHAFERGVVHRDIKPGNLLVAAGNGRAPVVKILDFGLARFLSEGEHKARLTRVGAIVGTVDYLSPEQAENARKADTRSDTYSLGCSLYYLLTGQPPFLGADVVERLSARLLAESPSVRALRPEVPEALEGVLAKMMARDPAHRYQTPGEVAAALAPFAGRQAVTIPPSRPVPSAGPKNMDDPVRRTVAGPKSGVVPSAKSVAGDKAPDKKRNQPAGDNPRANHGEGNKNSGKRSSSRIDVAEPKAKASRNKWLLLGFAFGGGIAAILAVVLVIVLPRGGNHSNEDPGPIVPAPEPLKVKIEDESLIWIHEVGPKVTHKIEDEPEERNAGIRPPPVKVSIRDEPENGPDAIKNLSIDPDPRIVYRYGHDVVFENKNRKDIPRYDQFGITAVKDRAGQLLHKRLTYAADGSTNNTRLKIDGKDMNFGKGAGKWLVQGEEVPDDPERKTKGGTKSVLRAGDIEITQILEIVPSKQPVEVGPEEKKELKYVLDTLLVRYVLENKGKAAHKAGLRVQVDTLIGDNDGVPFTIPGHPGLCITRADLRDKKVPAFIQALELPDLQNPGLVAHMTLKLGGKLESPDRVCLAHWETGNAPWETKLAPMGKDSAVFLYWDEKPLAPGLRREFGFAYGLGGVDAGEGEGKLGITLDGSFEPGQFFTVTAFVNNPVSGQSLTLELPAGLQAVGAAKVAVPRAVGKPPTSVVTWKAKALQTGEFRIRVNSSTGLAQSKTVVIARGEEPDPGKLALKLTGPFEPGKAFAVEAEVIGPAPEQRLRLELPAGLERVAGEAEQAVPKAGDEEMKRVRWEVKVNEPGTYLVGVRSDTGVGRAKTLTIVKNDQGGAVQVALRGDIEPGKAFAVLAKVDEPAPEQKLTLILPDELERVSGAETQPVPPGKGGKELVGWGVKVLKSGKFTLRVRSSTGVTYPKTITLQETEQNVGRFELEFVGAVAPGKEFRVVARVNNPVSKQELKLTLPPGLQLVEGSTVQPVPPLLEGGARVSWTVRVVERGRLPVRVDSSTGIARTSTITISGGAGPGQIFGK